MPAGAVLHLQVRIREERLYFRQALVCFGKSPSLRREAAASVLVYGSPQTEGCWDARDGAVDGIDAMLTSGVLSWSGLRP
jgi:hypothetical protein